MFTGIITDMGQVRAARMQGDFRARIGCAYDTDTIDIGASIACDGVCLTVVEKGRDDKDNWFDVEISAETIARTNIPKDGWAVGTRLNLERALRLGDELGGHIVLGHVDGVAHIESMHEEGDSLRVRFKAPEDLARFIAPKGSVTLNGTSLTVNEVEGRVFGINLIPHTRQVTTWGNAKTGDAVNLEIDTLARYVARLNEYL